MANKCHHTLHITKMRSVEQLFVDMETKMHDRQFWGISRHGSVSQTNSYIIIMHHKVAIGEPH